MKLEDKLLQKGAGFGEEIEILQNFRRNPTDSVKTHLIKAYLLNFVYSFAKDNPEFKENGFEQGQEWVRLWGTRKAIEICLSWIGIEKMILKEGDGKRWNTCQIGYRFEELSEETVKKIKALFKVSSPARSRLSRIYHLDKDVKSFSLSSNRANFGTNPLSNYSGTLEEGIWIQR